MTSVAEMTAARGAELRLPSYPWRFAHLAALWGFGVSQPVFSMLKGNPEFLVVRGSTRADVVLFALLLAFAPPLLVVLAEAVIGLVWALLSRALHIAAVWCFGFLAVLQVVRMSEPERAVALLLPLLPAAALAFAYMRWNAFRAVLSISLALPVLGVLSFVATIPLAVGDAKGADVAVRTPTPVVLVVLDEFPRARFSAPTARSTRCATRDSHGLRATGSGIRVRRPSTSSRPRPCRRFYGKGRGARRPSHAHRSSGEPLHAARRAVRVQGARAGHAALPDSLLPRGAGALGVG